MITNITKAEEYYTLIGQKNKEDVKKFLDDKVEFKSPLAQIKGKQAVVSATCNFMDALTALRIRAKFAAEDKALIVYDVDLPGIAENFPGVSLLTFRNGFIVNIELFHDASLFGRKREEIFSWLIFLIYSFYVFIYKVNLNLF